MATRESITERLLEIIEPVCASAGYELVDVQYTQSPAGWVVRVFIDHLPGTAPGDGAISFTDCERMSRELSAVLDVEDPIPHAYNLEVSSPGLARPLRTAAHFERFAGEVVKVTTSRPLAGRRNFKGTLRGVAGEATIEMLVDGVLTQIPLADVASASVVPDWDALMSGKQR
jgi:ribosome maturation factor RimP